VPICFVSARSGAGVKELLDLFERLMPSPAEANPPQFVKGSGPDAQFRLSRIRCRRSTSSPTCSRSSTIPSSASSACSASTRARCAATRSCSSTTARSRSRSGTCSSCKGKDHVEIEDAIPGDIAAVAKIDEIHFDAVLHDSHDEDQIHLKPMDFPRPMFGLAIEPLHKGQEQKLATALHKLHEEDPCFRIEHNKELNETVIRGLGELHLR
jgi:elongation factor G